MAQPELLQEIIDRIKAADIHQAYESLTGYGQAQLTGPIAYEALSNRLVLGSIKLQLDKPQLSAHELITSIVTSAFLVGAVTMALVLRREKDSQAT